MKRVVLPAHPRVFTIMTIHWLGRLTDVRGRQWLWVHVVLKSWQSDRWHSVWKREIKKRESKDSSWILENLLHGLSKQMSILGVISGTYYHTLSYTKCQTPLSSITLTRCFIWGGTYAAGESSPDWVTLAQINPPGPKVKIPLEGTLENEYLRNTNPKTVLQCRNVLENAHHN